MYSQNQSSTISHGEGNGRIPNSCIFSCEYCQLGMRRSKIDVKYAVPGEEEKMILQSWVVNQKNGRMHSRSHDE